MTKVEQLRGIVEEFIDIVHTQTKEIEKLIEHIERSAGHLAYRNQFSVVASRLSELHLRTKQLPKPRRRAAVAAHG